MPIGSLALKHLSSLIPIVPVVLGVLFLISWKVPAVNSAQAAAITSTILALALAAYTILCLLVMAMHS